MKRYSAQLVVFRETDVGEITGEPFSVSEIDLDHAAL